MNEIAIVVFLFIGVWVLANWLMLPFIISRDLESIKKAIEKLGDK